MEFLKAILASVAAVIVCGFCPRPEWVAAKSIEAAASKMPETHRERMREEWYAELNDQPGGFWTLCWAIDLLRGAKNIADALKELEVEQANIGIRPIVKAKNCKACGGTLASNVTKCIHCGASEPIKKDEGPSYAATRSALAKKIGLGRKPEPAESANAPHKRAAKKG